LPPHPSRPLGAARAPAGDARGGQHRSGPGGGLMRPRLARLLVRAYPRAWRRRYGSEYAALLEDVPATAAASTDAVGAAVALQARAACKSLITSGGSAVTMHFGGSHARTLALLAILAAFEPTAG